MRTVLTVSLIALVAACGSADDDLGATLDGEWVAVSGVSDGVDVELLDGFAVTIGVDRDRLTGTSACNRYSGTVAVGGDGSFEASDLSWTEIGCERPVLEVEQAYLTSLSRFTNYTVTDEILTLSSATDEWVFVPAGVPG